MQMVADMSDQTGTAADGDTVSVCTIGVYGTKYARSSTVPESLEMVSGDAQTVSIERIQSSLSIGNELDIQLRQSSNLDFV